MTRAVLALGANLGDRLAALQGAVDALAAGAGIRVVAVSSVYETDPVGGPEQPAYLNAVVVVDTNLQPEDLLAFAQDIEQQWQRVREVRWGPRTLDIDIISFGAVVQDDSRLTLPHPRAAERAFVLAPWREVEPDAELEGHGRISELRVDERGVRRHDEELVLP